MFGTHDFLLFVLSGLLLNVTPGADTLYIVGRSAAQGFRGGLLAALGIGAGCLVHILAATLGLSAILAASATAFTVVKLMGAAYLLYLGATLLRSASTAPASPKSLPPSRDGAVFWQGFLTNVLNPKVALFFLAFLPQFIALDAPSKPLAMLFLGLVFDVNGTLWNVFLAYAASGAARRLSHGEGVGRWLSRAAGSLFIYFGIRLALDPR